METDIKLYSVLKKYLPAITEDQIRLFQAYHTLLKEWNQKINLVSRKEEETIWSRHVIGSIAFLFQFELSLKSDILDIGTGGGLPGIPLAILYPDSRLTLIDSIQKKITAVDDMVLQLELKNVKTLCGRAEEISRRAQYGKKYDYVVSRAVAPVRDIMKWCKPFLRPGDEPALQEKNDRKLLNKGSFVFLKGGDLTDEISYAKVKFKPREIQYFDLRLIEEIPELTDKRLIVIKP